MLLPALGKVKETANLTMCLNNTKQIGIAMQMYFDDNDSWVMPVNASFETYDSPGVYKIQAWPFSLSGYLGVEPQSKNVSESFFYNNYIVEKIPDVFFCPKNTCQYRTATNHVGYGINRWLTAGDPFQHGVPKKRVSVPTRRLLVSCQSEAVLKGGQCASKYNHMEVQPSTMEEMVTVSNNATPGIRKHGGRVPVLFIAGNVAVLSGQQIEKKGDEWTVQGVYLPWGMRYRGSTLCLIDRPIDPGDF